MAVPATALGLVQGLPNPPRVVRKDSPVNHELQVPAVQARAAASPVQKHSHLTLVVVDGKGCSQGIVVPRNGLGDLQVPSGPVVHHALQHVPAVRVRVKLVPARYAGRNPHRDLLAQVIGKGYRAHAPHELRPIPVPVHPCAQMQPRRKRLPHLAEQGALHHGQIQLVPPVQEGQGSLGAENVSTRVLALAVTRVVHQEVNRGLHLDPVLLVLHATHQTRGTIKGQTNVAVRDLDAGLVGGNRAGLGPLRQRSVLRNVLEQHIVHCQSLRRYLHCEAQVLHVLTRSRAHRGVQTRDLRGNGVHRAVKNSH
mmetsp:Transcript_1403/g.4037  ORF Transcript_1403/g.4037 Transcript_1403/m.4037 type:complete len:310 (-) Transcript_1403:1810-2739(-)